MKNSLLLTTLLLFTLCFCKKDDPQPSSNTIDQTNYELTFTGWSKDTSIEQSESGTAKMLLGGLKVKVNGVNVKLTSMAPDTVSGTIINQIISIPNQLVTMKTANDNATVLSGVGTINGNNISITNTVLVPVYSHDVFMYVITITYKYRN